MKTIIFCVSNHHGNTLKVAQVMAEKLKAQVKKPREFRAADIDKFNLIGFGSGMYNGKHHASIFELVSGLDQQMGKPAFIFSTASISYKKMHEPLRKALSAKGFRVIDEFICPGFMDYSFIGWFGGMNKGRPNRDDLHSARQFALNLTAKRIRLEKQLASQQSSISSGA